MSIVILHTPDIDVIENINKMVYDQSVLIQPTLGFLDVYALMPSDNSGNVAVGADVQFPNIGATSASDIVKTTPSTFTLGPIGVYNVFFNVGIDSSGQLVVTLNNVQLPRTVVGTTSPNAIIGQMIITTTVVNSVLTIRNPTGNIAALTIKTNMGGTNAVSAHLIITRLR